MALAAMEMVNRLKELYVRTAEGCGSRAMRIAKALTPSGLLVSVLMILATEGAFSQRTHIVLDDKKVLVTRIDISHGATYTLPKDQIGDVWIAIDSVELVTIKDGKGSRKLLDAGDSAIVRSEEQLLFRQKSTRSARLVIVRPKSSHQDLTVESFILDSLEDASDRNATLLVAISDCHFRDTRDLGDENGSLLGKPDAVLMKSGSARWILPGIHSFKTIGPTVAKLVSIEW